MDKDEVARIMLLIKNLCQDIYEKDGEEVLCKDSKRNLNYIEFWAEHIRREAMK